LAGVDLEVPEAQTTVLIGPSGCGKSTLLRLAAGLIRPDRGKVWFEGNTLDPHHLRPARLRMGYMIQDGGLFPHLTVRDNVTLMARELDWPRNGASSVSGSLRTWSDSRAQCSRAIRSSSPAASASASR
jgi:osmoprotectant transport system ATP-binding protein